MRLRGLETTFFRILDTPDSSHSLVRTLVFTLKLRHRVMGEEAVVRVNVADPTAVGAVFADFDNRDGRNVLTREEEAVPRRAILRGAK